MTDSFKTTATTPLARRLVKTCTVLGTEAEVIFCNTCDKEKICRLQARILELESENLCMTQEIQRLKKEEK